MKKFLTLMITACIMLAVSESSFAQKKKKDKKSKVSVHGEKDNDGVYNQRKTNVNEGTAGKSKKKKNKKSKRDSGFIQSPNSNEFYVFYRRDENNDSSFS